MNEGGNGRRAPFWRSGTTLIFVGLVLGVVLGGFLPADEHPTAFALFQFCSKSFLSLIKGIIVPLLFATIVTGIAQTGDLKAVGRMGAKSLLYFEIVTTLALVLGLVIANWVRPGDGLPLHVEAHTQLAAPKSGWEIALHAFPSNVVKHAAEGDILPVVVFAALFGVALTRVGERGEPVLRFFDGVAQVMFKYTSMVMALTPIGVFGAMAYNVSHMAAKHPGSELEGWPAVFDLLKHYSLLVGSLYLSLFLLFVLVFVPIMLIARIPVKGFVDAIREPALMAFSTASSEAALPLLLEKIEKLGVPRRVASFVIPTGYSFNLDGSTLYLVLASLTIAQAAKIEMPISTQIAMVFTFMLTSKGVAGVPRATLVIIAGTTQGFGLPGEAGVAMILAVDEIMDMARSALNLTGNGLAACVIARWEGVFGENTAPAER
ncbi:Proton/glutamate symport protein [Labilithrix luteola]|uniref:Proton/glutamate symport protein n=1 Tax=Labilithrix luteola TaxID=1391654 RepID=A0A0K1QEN8_9BACT|nr:cation:dicarboxylase symporter family transporter [Labilithrix luteola]AKV04214.1 Proton/glutamate symport protein [Labilithrix luteola]